MPRYRSVHCKLKKLNHTMSEQKAALDEIKRSIPRPFVRILVPRDTMQAAFDKVVHECSVQGTFESRPIRVPKSRASPFNTPAKAAPSTPLTRSQTSAIKPAPLFRAQTSAAILQPGDD